MEFWWKWCWQGKAEVLGRKPPSPKCSSRCFVLKSSYTFRPMDVPTRAVGQCNWVWSTCGLIQLCNIQQITKCLRIVTLPARSLWFWLCASEWCIPPRVWHAVTCFHYSSNRYTSTSGIVSGEVCNRCGLNANIETFTIDCGRCSRFFFSASLPTSQRTLSAWWKAVAARCWNVRRSLYKMSVIFTIFQIKSGHIDKHSQNKNPKYKILCFTVHGSHILQWGRPDIHDESDIRFSHFISERP